MYLLDRAILFHVFPLTVGVRQGGVLSPLLFNVYVDSFIQRLEASNHAPILHMYRDMRLQGFWGHEFDLLGSCDLIGHVTIGLGICWFLLVVHWNHASILYRYGDIKPQVAFAHVKGQKFTAHAPCHVTSRQGAQNDHIFEICEAILSIDYTTFTGLRWRLRAVYRWNFLYRSVFDRKFRFWAQFSTLGGFFRG